MKKYLDLIRAKHYVKNILVFAALVCSGQLFNAEKFISGLAGFIIFCLISSFVYIINDIRDREADMLHPTKKNRPIAAGTIPVKTAAVIAAVFLALALLCGIIRFGLMLSLLPIAYIILNIAYSMGLKNIPIADIAVLVSGFFIRILYGALITGITISNWLYLTVIALSFFFAFGKRRNELKRISGGETRQVLKFYTVDFLDRNMTMCITMANIFYALWSMDEKTAALYENGNIVFTVPIVMLISMKYSLDIEQDPDGDPVEVLLHDKVLLLLCMIYFAVMLAILYL